MNENIFSTGELKGIEQALAVRTAKGIVVIAGCSHPGVTTTWKQLPNLEGHMVLWEGCMGFVIIKF